MRSLSRLFSLAIAAGITIPAAAYTVWDDGQGLTYHLFSNGDAALYSVASNMREVTIPARIMVDGTEYQVTEWEECDLRRVEKLVIEAPITEIPASRFYRHTNLRSVTLPQTLTTIGERAFYYSGLTSVEFPPSLTTIGAYSFSACKIKYLDVPQTITDIGSRAFSETPVEMVSYNSGCGTLGPDLFAECRDLRVVYLGDNIESVGKGTILTSTNKYGYQWSNYLDCEEAFKDSPLTDVYIDTPTPPAWYMDLNRGNYIGAGMTTTDKDITLYVSSSAAELYVSYEYGLGTIFTGQHAPYPETVTLSLQPYNPSVHNARFKRIEGIDGAFVAPDAITISGQDVITTTTPGQLTAAFFPENTTMRALSWHSDNPAIASVDQNGLVKGIEVGVANIYAESPFSGAKSEPFRVTVASISPTDFTLDRYIDHLVIGIGGQYTLTPTYEPDPCSEGLLFTSSDTDIATVDSDGTVKAIRRGNCVITGTAIFGGKTRELAVTVVPTATELVINELEEPLIAGGAPVRLIADVRPAASAGELVIWSLQFKQDNFTLSRDGEVTPLKQGYAYVAARTLDGREARATFPVDYANAERIIMPESITLDHLDIEKLVTSVEPAIANQNVKLTIDNPQIVDTCRTIYYGESRRDIIGLAAGEATITATDVSGNITATTKVMVNPCEYTINLSSTEMRFDSDLSPVNDETPTADVCVKDGIRIYGYYSVEVINSHSEKGYKLSVIGTEPAEYAEKHAAAGSYFYGYTKAYAETFCDVPRHWSISDESVAKIYPFITGYNNIYDPYNPSSIIYAPYAKEVAVLPLGEGTATITYDPEDGSGVTATCVISVGSTVGIDNAGTSGDITITTDGNRILAANPEKAEIAVFTAAGTLVARGDSEEFATPPLPSGIYMVATPAETTKIAL